MIAKILWSLLKRVFNIADGVTILIYFISFNCFGGFQIKAAILRSGR